MRCGQYPAVADIRTTAPVAQFVIVAFGDVDFIGMAVGEFVVLGEVCVVVLYRRVYLDLPESRTGFGGIAADNPAIVILLFNFGRGRHFWLDLGHAAGRNE